MCARAPALEEASESRQDAKGGQVGHAPNGSEIFLHLKGCTTGWNPRPYPSPTAQSAAELELTPRICASPSARMRCRNSLTEIAEEA